MAVISSQLNNTQEKLFAKRHHAAFRFVSALLLSFGIMIADYHYRSIDFVRRGISTFVSPIQFSVDYPARLLDWTRSMLSSKTRLIDENIQLRYQQTILEARLQKFLSLQNENVALKALLSASSTANMQAMAAQILAVDTTDTRQLLVLDKGTRDGVQVGLPVLDAKGVMGQIVDVGLMTSTVLLISDSKCAVPVRNDRTGERAILVGTNHIGRLSLINLPRSSSVVKGDLLVTSGLGRRYPEGYPVGRVEEVRVMPGDDFIKVSVSPISRLNQSRLALLIWPEPDHDELTAQIEARLKFLEGLA